MPPVRVPSGALTAVCASCGAAKEKVVGWYHTGPRLRQSDLDITELMARYCDHPLLVICEVQVPPALMHARLYGPSAPPSGGVRCSQ